MSTCTPSSSTRSRVNAATDPSEEVRVNTLVSTLYPGSGLRFRRSGAEWVISLTGFDGHGSFDRIERSGRSWLALCLKMVHDGAVRAAA